MENIKVIKGTELKLNLNIENIEVPLSNLDMKVWAYCNNNNKLFLPPSNIKYFNDSHDNCFVFIDTSLINTGTLYLEVSVDIPDNDFTDVGDRCRREIYRIKTNIKIVK